jgi:serine/threonine-protein kinase
MTEAPPESSFRELWSTLALDDTIEASPPETLTPAPGEIPQVRDFLASLPVLLGDGGPVDLPTDLEPMGELGAGGMGVVRLARQRSLRREVAVKSLQPGGSEHAADGLVTEARITGSLEHPGIVPVYALGRDLRGSPVLVMKRVSGVSWRELLHNPSHLEWARHPGDRLLFHVQVLMKLCDALDFAHSRGVVHRDLKPANVMLGRYGEVYLLDWGIAWREGDEVAVKPLGARVQVVGTPSYMAPEMLDHRIRPTPATDVYLLGANLHEVLTRSPRHQGGSLQSVLFRAFASEPVEYGPDIPDELGALANAATRRNPSDRPSSAGEFKRALEAWIEHRGSSQLSDAARVRLIELRACAPATAPLARVHALYGECAFGFSEALRVFEGNLDAARGIDEVEAWMTQYELARGDPDAAAVHLERSRTRDFALVAEVEALRAKKAAERDEVERLKKLERALDPKLGAQSRLRVFVWSASVSIPGLLVSSWLARAGWVRMSYGLLYAFLGVGFVVAAANLRRYRALDVSVHGVRLRLAITVTMATHLLAVTLAFLLRLPPWAVVPFVFSNITLNMASLAVQGDRLLAWVAAWAAVAALTVAVVLRFAPAHAFQALLAVAITGGVASVVRALAAERRT